MNFSIVDENQDRGTVIKVIGVGGGGSNAVNRMIECGIVGIDFIAANTDGQALQRSLATSRVVLGRAVTKGLGAGGKPEVGAAAAEEDTESIKAALAGADMVFVTAGMGGGTGTGAAPVIAKIAKDMGALTVAVVTTPFHYEGQRKMRLAMEGIEKLAKSVDTLITIPNEKLLSIMEPGSSVKDSFNKADDILRMGVQGISEIIMVPGEINIDFADVRTTMEGKGMALFGMGRGSGETRAFDAVTTAIRNPILEDVKIEGAMGVLVSITASTDFTMEEVSDIMGIITQNAHPDAMIIHGLAYSENLKDEVTVSVIATGFQGSEALKVSGDSRVARIGEKVSGRDRAQEEYLNFEDFDRILGGGKSASPSASVPKQAGNSFLGARNTPPDNNMEVPTYIRLKQQKEMTAR